MNKVILVRFGELFLKGGNRGFFEKLLIKNIKYAIEPFNAEFSRSQSRYIIDNFDNNRTEELINRLKKVFGIHSLSIAYKVNSTKEEIFEAALLLAKPGKFKAETNRADKKFGYSSMQFSALLGGEILSKIRGSEVDVHKPSYIIYTDIREDGKSFVFTDIIPGAGGLPHNTAGHGMLMLSGGIDSPVAGYMMARRGMRISAVHFYSYPYTSELAKEKVITLAKHLAEYGCGMDLYIVPFTAIQDTINQRCKNQYLITIMRRFMMRITEKLAEKNHANAIINGECLGQVASQTLESINVTGSTVKIPVLRPLIGFDKQDIIEIAQKISTFNTSILPYEDCCTVFVPKNPVIKPTIAEAEYQEKFIENINELIEEAVNNTEKISV